MASNIQYNDVRKQLVLVLMEDDRPFGKAFMNCADANDYVNSELGSWRGFSLIPVEVECGQCPICGKIIVGKVDSVGSNYGGTVAPGCGCAHCNPPPTASCY